MGRSFLQREMHSRSIVGNIVMALLLANCHAFTGSTSRANHGSKNDECAIRNPTPSLSITTFGVVRKWRKTPSSSSLLKMVESITLETLNDNHEEVGQEMADSIIRWLDSEWMPQPVHIAMANRCKETYIKYRTGGETDLMAMMTYIADDLNANWKEYNKDAFVNAWDISNYVSDYLTSKRDGDIEQCECSSKIY